MVSITCVDYLCFRLECDYPVIRAGPVASRLIRDSPSINRFPRFSFGTAFEFGSRVRSFPEQAFSRVQD